MPPSVLLDFFAITNPVILLESLILFRQTESEIVVAESSVKNIEIDWATNDICDIKYDLTNPEIIKFISSDWNLADAGIYNTNLPLAISIFQHAVREGYIKILSPKTKLDPHTSKLMENLSLPRGSILDYPDYGGMDGPITICPDVPWDSYDNLSLALSNGFGLLPAHPELRKLKNDPLLHNTDLFLKVEQKMMTEPLHLRSLSDIDSYFALIDKPTLLPEIVEAANILFEDKNYKKDLKLFFPRLIFDTLTGGLASHAEMLFKIYRKKFEKK